MPLTTEDKQQFVKFQVEAVEAEIWKLDTLAAAMTKAGLKDRAEALAKQSAEQRMLVQALASTPVE